MRIFRFGAFVVAAVCGLILAHGPAGAQNYRPGDTVKWRGMGAQTQKAMEERSQFLEEKRRQQALTPQKPPAPPATQSRQSQQPKQTRTYP